MSKFYAFLSFGACGEGYRVYEFKDEDGLLYFIKKVKADDEGLYKDLIVIRGTKIDLESFRDRHLTKEG